MNLNLENYNKAKFYFDKFENNFEHQLIFDILKNIN